MRNYIVEAWEWFKLKVNAIANIAVPLSRSIRIAIALGDVTKIRGHAKEAREFGNKWIQIADFLESAVADDTMDLYEGAEALNLLNQLADEGEDVISGVDEDDTIPGQP
jgi:hypothetical protein